MPVDDLGIAHDVVVLVVDRRMLEAGQLQVDAHTLLGVLLVAVDPDPAGQDQVAHEHFHGAAMRNAAGNAVTFSAGDDMMALILSDARRTLGLVKEPHPGAPVNGI